ncbi:MAG: substrate-binding domain-containing protein [Spirochaetota bacterium]
MRIAYIHAGMRFESYVGSPIYDAVCRGMSMKGKGSIDFFDARCDPVRLLAGKVRFDGVLGTIPAGARRKGWHVLSRKVPSVDVMIDSGAKRGNYAGTDEADGIRKIMDHLCAEGHEHIGYFGTSAEGFARARYRAYREYMREHSLMVRRAWMFGPDAGSAPRLLFSRHANKRFEAFVSARIDAVLGMKERPSAMVFESDLAAYMFITRGRSLRIPADMAITGFDDKKPGDGDDFPLTTCAQDFTAIGKAAVDLLCDIMSGDRPRTGNQVLIPPRLIIRRSSRKRTLERSAMDDGFAAEVRRSIEEHYADENLSHALSDMLGFNHKYFLDKFHAVFGVHYIDYLNDLRLTRAEELLRNTDDAVTEILLDTGFKSHQNFNRFFQRRYGMTAARYRAKHR